MRSLLLAIGFVVQVGLFAQSFTAHIPQAAGAPYLLSQHRLHRVDTLAFGRFDANGNLQITLPKEAREGVFRMKWPQGQMEGLWAKTPTRFRVLATGEPEILEGEEWRKMVAIRRALWNLRQQQQVLQKAQKLFEDDAAWQSKVSEKNLLLTQEEDALRQGVEKEVAVIQAALWAEWDFIGRDEAYFRQLQKPAAALEALDFRTDAMYYHPSGMQHIVMAFNLFMEQKGVPASLLGLQFVQQLMNSVEQGDPIYFDAVVDFLRVGLEQMNQVPALQYLAGRVAEQESCSDAELRSQLEAKLSTYLRITPGNIPPLLQDLVDREGKTVTHQPQRGLYVFWATHCTHCQEQIPQLYERWNEANQPLPVVTISIGGDADSWRRLTKDWTAWTHWRDPQQNEGATVQNYLIYATPFIVEVDEAGKIARVYRSADEIKW